MALLYTTLRTSQDILVSAFVYVPFTRMRQIKIVSSADIRNNRCVFFCDRIQSAFDCEHEDGEKIDLLLKKAVGNGCPL